MRSPLRNRVACALPLLLTFTAGGQLAAQEAPVAPAAPAAPPFNLRAALAKTFEKMSLLQGVSFESTEKASNALAGLGIAGGGGGRSGTEVDGRWMPGMASYEIGDDQILRRGGVTIARDMSRDWAPRAGRLANGRKAPFLFDPALFFSALGALSHDDLEILRQKAVTVPAGERLLVNLTIEGDAASELVFSGALPEVKGGISVIALGLGGGGPPTMDLTVDVALWIDLGSHLVDEVKVKAYSNEEVNGFGGGGGVIRKRVVFRVGAGGAGGGGGAVVQEADEKKAGNAEGEDKPEAASADSFEFSGGLPKREEMKEHGFITLDIELSAHDQPFVPELDAQAKRLLRRR